MGHPASSIYKRTFVLNYLRWLLRDKKKLRRATPAKPKIPVPNNTQLEGSGVTWVPEICIAYVPPNLSYLLMSEPQVSNTTHRSCRPRVPAEVAKGDELFHARLAPST